MSAGGLNWSLFDGEFHQFREYAFGAQGASTSKGRVGWGPWEDHSACNKIYDRLKLLLGRVACKHPEEDPTFAWLLDISDEGFDFNFDDHLEFLKQRKNVSSTRVQTMRSFQRPLEWAAKVIGLMDRTERAAFVNEYSSFCSECASSTRTEVNKRHNDGRLKAALNPPMGLEEYVSKVGAHVESTLEAVETGGVADTQVDRARAAVLAMSTIGRCDLI
jgi:hypothetical protein